jgi:hypothetical protein
MDFGKTGRAIKTAAGKVKAPLVSAYKDVKNMKQSIHHLKKLKNMGPQYQPVRLFWGNRLKKAGKATLKRVAKVGGVGAVGVGGYALGRRKAKPGSKKFSKGGK